MLGNVLKVLEARGTDSYELELRLLLGEYKNRYHELLQLGVMFSVLMFDDCRGQEDLAELS